MVRSAELAERLDVRLHTHFAENAEDDEFSLATFGCRPTDYLERTGWLTDRAWLAHCVMPDADEVRRLGAAGVGVAHCPSSNLILASGIAPVVALRAAGVPSGSASTARRRPTRRRCGWRPARRCCWPSCATARRRHGPDGAGDGDARRGGVPRPHRRARRAGAGRRRRRRRVVADRPGVRRGDRRPGRGVAALRPGRGPRHDRPRRGASWTAAGSSTRRSTSACAAHRRVADAHPGGDGRSAAGRPARLCRP